jgi:Cu-Zn family superoxide dismutase
VKNIMMIMVLMGLLSLIPCLPAHSQTAGGQGISKAVAVVHPIQGNKVQGIVIFTRVDKGLRIVAEFEGLAPGNHGFHVHQYGDCSSPNGVAAGDHFNPFRKPHGGPSTMERHAGDLGNLRAGADGKARLEWTDPLLTFDGPDSIIGRSVIVHGMPDDFASQPAGNSGPRIGCGVIGLGMETK